MALPRNVTRMLAAVLVVSATVFAASLRRSSPTAGDVGDEALLEAVRTHARDRLVTWCVRRSYAFFPTIVRAHRTSGSCSALSVTVLGGP